jgi:hypothetical protein
MAQTIINREEYTHPENIHTDLVYVSDTFVPTDKFLETRENIQTCSSLRGDFPKEKQESCWNCGWSVDNEVYASYGSCV